MASDVFEELQALTQRYLKLRPIFVQFHKGAKDIMTQPGWFQGLEFSELKEPAHFDVTLAGTTTRFAFSFDAAASRGKVTVSRVDPWDASKTTEVGVFRYDGQGDTGLKVTGGNCEGDPILVTFDGGAAHMVAIHLCKALGAGAAPATVLPLRL